jgi:hypothetical protein
MFEKLITFASELAVGQIWDLPIYKLDFSLVAFP